ncbi:MAG: insulinase family protein [Rhizomicrobium sp.]
MKLGPDAGAVTFPDKTEYLLDLPDNAPAALDAALFVMREFAGNLLFQPDAVNHERNTILGEERLWNTPQTQAMSGWRKAAFTGQKFVTAGNAIGSTDVIKTVPPQALVAFYHAFYRPALTTLVITGDIDPVQIEAKIKANFADWKAVGAARHVTFEPYKTKGLQTFTYAAPSVTDMINATWFQPYDTRAGTRAKANEDMADSILIGILNTRLQRRAQQDDAAYVGAGIVQQPIFQTAQLLQFGIMPKPGQYKKTFEQIMQVYRQFVSFGVTAEEIAPIVAAIEANTKNDVAGAKTRNSAAIADAIIANLDANDVLTSPVQNEAEFARQKPSLTVEKLNLRLKILFAGDGPLLARIAENSGDYDAAAMKATYLSAMQETATAYKAEAAARWPYTDFGNAQIPIAQKEYKDFGVTRYSFANGLTLNVKTTKFKDNQVLVNVGYKGGLETLPPQTNAPTWLTNAYTMSGSFVSGGLKKITLEQIDRALAGKNFNVIFGISEQEATFSGVTTEADLPTQLQLLMAYATDAAYRPALFDQLHSALPMIYTQQASNPLIMLQSHLRDLTHAGDKRFVLPSLAEAEATSLAQVQNQIQTMLAKSPVEITIVGDVNPDTAVKSVAATFATLPILPKTVAIADGGDHSAFPTQNLQQILHHNGRSDQSHSLLAWPVPGETQDTQVSRGLEILTEILNFRAFNTIRQNLGQAYDANAKRDQSWAFKDFGYIAISGSVATGNDAAFVTAVNGIIDDLKTHPVSQDELDRARKPLLEHWQNDQNDNQHWVYTITHVDDQSTIANVVYKTRDEMNAVTPAMIRDLVQKYFVADRALHVEILPQNNAGTK